MTTENQGNYFEIENKRLISLGFFLLIILSLIFLISLYISRNIRVYEEKIIAQIEKSNPFENINIEARSAIVWDIINSRALFEKNPDEKLPLASITKIMMAVTALDLVPQNTVITIDRKFLEEEGDSGLFANEKWQLKDLINFSMVVSSNDAATAIASITGGVSAGTDVFDIGKQEFINKMNEKAFSIGMEKTVFYKEHGLDRDRENSGAYGSARDTVKLFEYALKNHPEILEATKYQNVKIRSLNDISHNAENTNQSVGDIPGLLASKTGYTELSGGNLGVIIDPGIGRPIIIVVLGSTYEKRFEDVAFLSTKTLEYLDPS